MKRIATKENMPKRLKILTHNNTTLYNLTLIAGVGNHNQDNQENHNQDQKQTDNSSLLAIETTN